MQLQTIGSATRALKVASECTQRIPTRRKKRNPLARLMVTQEHGLGTSTANAKGTAQKGGKKRQGEGGGTARSSTQS